MMHGERNTAKFTYTVVPVNGLAAPNERLPLYAELVFSTFRFSRSAYEDIFGAHSQATLIGYEKERPHRPNKVAVLAVAFSSNHATTMWVADRSTRNTHHVAGFLREAEQRTFLDPAMQSLTIQPVHFDRQLLLNRGYTRQTIGGLAFRLTADDYNLRPASPSSNTHL